MTKFVKNCEEKIEAWHEYFDKKLYLNFYMEPSPEEFREMVDCGYVMLSQFEDSEK